MGSTLRPGVFWRWLVVLLIFGGPAATAEALVVTSTAGQTNLDVMVQGAPPAFNNPEFGPDGGGVNGALVYPGFQYPSLALGAVAATTGATVDVVPLSIFRGPIATGAGQFGNPGNGTGGGITAFPLSGPGASGGIGWFPYLLDDANAGAGTASAVYSRYAAVERNVTSGLFFPAGVYLLGVQGVIPPGGSVAAAMRGTFIDSLGNTFTQDVDFAADGPGGLLDFVLTNGGVNDPGSTLLLEAPFPGGGTAFAAFGFSLVGPLTITPGGFIGLDGTVSLIADPGASIEFATPPEDFLAKLAQQTPNGAVGFFAGVPEPSSLILMAAGMIALAVLRGRGWWDGTGRGIAGRP